MLIGVLALQGAFIEHEKMLETLGVNYFEIRKKEDLLQKFDGLIIPGGESTVIGKLLKELSLFDDIKKLIENGLPVFGTCAGLILLAKEVDDDKSYFATMDIVVKRNAYGRQLGSFSSVGDFDNLKNVKMIFIRAPYIEKASEKCKILACIDGKIVAAKQGNQLVASFHPELTCDIRVHKYFIDMIAKKE